jgi:putative spermidine/putrescine transport system ATP-binding protein
VVRCGGAALRAAEAPGSGAAEVFIRPHHVRPLAPAATADNILEGRVLRRTYTGDVVSLECETPAGRIQAELPGGAPGAALAAGAAVRLGFAAEDVRVFPA